MLRRRRLKVLSKPRKRVVKWKRYIEVASNRGVAERVADLIISFKRDGG